MENKNLHNVLINANLTDTCYFDSQTFYYDCFGTPAHISAIFHVNHLKIAQEIRTAFADQIDEVYAHAYKVIVVMKEPVLVELGNAYAEILHGRDNMELVAALTQFIQQFSLKRKKDGLFTGRYFYKEKRNEIAIGRLFNHKNAGAAIAQVNNNGKVKIKR